MYVAQESVKSTRVGSQRVRKYKPVWLTRRKARWWRFCLTAKGPQCCLPEVFNIYYADLEIRFSCSVVATNKCKVECLRQSPYSLSCCKCYSCNPVYRVSTYCCKDLRRQRYSYPNLCISSPQQCLYAQARRHVFLFPQWRSPTEENLLLHDCTRD